MINKIGLGVSLIAFILSIMILNGIERILLCIFFGILFFIYIGNIRKENESEDENT